MVEQQKQEQQRLREQKQAEEYRKEELINGIRKLFNYDLRKQLYKLSLSDIQVAHDRAIYLYSLRKEFTYFFRDDLLKLLTSDDLSYQEQIEVARQKKKQRDEEDKKRKEAEEFRKYDKLRYYQINYPQYGLSPETHMHLTEEQINKIIKTQSNRR